MNIDGVKFDPCGNCRILIAAAQEPDVVGRWENHAHMRIAHCEVCAPLWAEAVQAQRTPPPPVKRPAVLLEGERGSRWADNGGFIDDPMVY